MGRAWNRQGSGMRTKVWEDHLENLGIDGMPLLKLIIGNKAGGVNTIHMAQSREPVITNHSPLQHFTM